MIVFREMMLSDVEQISAMEEAYFSMPWSKQALSEAAAGDQTFYMVAEDMARWQNCCLLRAVLYHGRGRYQSGCGA